MTTRITHPTNPTQFYDIESKDGMALRSGKKINFNGTTEFYNETSLMISAFRLMDYVLYDGFNAHDEFHKWTADVINETMWRKELNYIIKNAGKYCIRCTRLVLLDNYFKKWRSTINIIPDLGIKKSSIYKIQEAIKFLEDLQEEGIYQFCGCTDQRRADIEDQEWFYFERYGPGYFQEVESDHQLGIGEMWLYTIGGIMQIWVLTPDVSTEEFQRQMDERITWRHNLLYLLESFEDHLAYLERIPHKAYQNVYFRIASSVGQDCAKHVLSFL